MPAIIQFPIRANGCKLNRTTSLNVNIIASKCCVVIVNLRSCRKHSLGSISYHNAATHLGKFFLRCTIFLCCIIACDKNLCAIFSRQIRIGI